MLFARRHPLSRWERLRAAVLPRLGFRRTLQYRVHRIARMAGSPYFLAGGAARPGATVVLDPPRSGAGAEVVRAIAESDPARVVYVACDPVALARDLKTFQGLGWRPVRLEAFDLFPNTHHLEAVAALVRD